MTDTSIAHAAEHANNDPSLDAEISAGNAAEPAAESPGEIAAREWATWCAGGLSIAETKDAEEAAASVAVNAILSQWDGALILQKRGDQIILWDDKAEEILTLECMVDTLSFLQKVQKDLARNAQSITPPN